MADSINVTVRPQKRMLVNQAYLINKRSNSLGALNVHRSTLVDGATLVYDSAMEEFRTTITLENQIIDGGNY